MTDWKTWRRKRARKHYHRKRAQRTGHSLGGLRTWALFWSVSSLRNGHYTAWCSTPEQNAWQRERQRRREEVGLL